YWSATKKRERTLTFSLFLHIHSQASRSRSQTFWQLWHEPVRSRTPDCEARPRSRANPANGGPPKPLHRQRDRTPPRSPSKACYSPIASLRTGGRPPVPPHRWPEDRN